MFNLSFAILWNCAFRCEYFSPLLFDSLLFTAICKPSSDSHFALLHFFFLGMVFAGVQLQQPGIQPEEVNGVGDETASHFSFGLAVYFKFKILFYTLGQRFDIFRSPSPRFIISINHCCSSNRVPASVTLWKSAFSSVQSLSRVRLFATP